MTLHPAVVFLGGLVVIVVGSEMLLRAASRIASMLGVTPIVIGLTVVSVGTSMPELAVGITAATEGRGPLAVGNIAGTNIVNILLILGLSALIRPLPTRSLSVKLDVPIMILSALVLLAMSMDGILTRTEGVLLVLGAIAYTAVLVRLSKRESKPLLEEFSEEFGKAALKPGKGWRHGLINAAMLLLGVALAVLGADLLVAGAVAIANAYGVSDAIIGLTIVAIGTSAPELFTTLIATYHDDRDVAVGNLIGSSVYNILVILGLTMIAAPGGVEVGNEVLWIDLPLSAAVALVCLPVFKSDRCVSRREGAFFVGAYVVYLSGLLFVRA